MKRSEAKKGRMIVVVPPGGTQIIFVDDTLEVANLGADNAQFQVTDAAGNVSQLSLGPAGGDDDTTEVECAPGDASVANQSATSSIRLDNGEDEDSGGGEGGPVS